MLSWRRSEAATAPSAGAQGSSSASQAAPEAIQRTVHPLCIVSPGGSINDLPPASKKILDSTVNLYVRANIVSLSDLDTVGQKFTCDVWIIATWRAAPLPPNEWSPRLHFRNALTILEREDRASRDTEGNNHYKMRIRGVFAEQFDLREFPYDRQSLQLNLSSHRPFPSSDQGGGHEPHAGVQLLVDRSVAQPGRLQLQNVTFAASTRLEKVHFSTGHTPRAISTSGTEYPLCVIAVPFTRRVSYFHLNVILPLFLIVCVGFSAWAVDRENVDGRLEATISCIIATTTYKYMVASALPQLPYLTLLDYYVVWCVFTLATVVLAITASARLDSDAHDRVLFNLLVLAWIASHAFAVCYIRRIHARNIATANRAVALKAQRSGYIFDKELV